MSLSVVFSTTKPRQESELCPYIYQMQVVSFHSRHCGFLSETLISANAGGDNSPSTVFCDFLKYWDKTETARALRLNSNKVKNECGTFNFMNIK